MTIYRRIHFRNILFHVTNAEFFPFYVLDNGRILCIRKFKTHDDKFEIVIMYPNGASTFRFSDSSSYSDVKMRIKTAPCTQLNVCHSNQI